MSTNAAINLFRTEFPNLSKGFKKVLTHLMGIRQSSPYVYPHQETISNKANVSIPTVKRAIAYFLNMGWIDVVRLRHRKHEDRSGNSYKISNDMFRLYKELTASDGRRSKAPYQQKFSRENDPNYVKNSSKMIPTPPKNDPYHGGKSSRENDPLITNLYLDKPYVGGDHNLAKNPKGSTSQKLDSGAKLTEEERIKIAKELYAISEEQNRTGKFTYEDDELKKLFKTSQNYYGTDKGLDVLRSSIHSVDHYKPQVKNKISLSMHFIKSGGKSLSKNL